MRLLIIKTCLALTVTAVCSNAHEVNGQNGGVLRGTVKLKDKAVAGVMVIVRSADAGHKTSLSNSKGEYEIHNLPNGTYLLTVGNTPYVLSDGIGGSFKQLDIKGGSITIADIALTEGGVLTGCVEYASKQPVIERQVIYENTDLTFDGYSLMSFRQTAVTDDQGCFRLFGLPGGKYRVGIGKPVNGLSTDLSAPFSHIYYPGVQRDSEAELVEVTAGQERKLGTLVLKNRTQTGIIKGSFIDSGSGDRVPNLSFELVRYDERGISTISSLVSDEAGEFQIENQAFGRYRIQPAVRAGRDTLFTFQSISFELDKTDTSEFLIECTSLSVRVRGEVRINNNDSASDKDCSIALKAGDGLGTTDGDVYRITLNRGKFELSGLPRGVYTLVILPLRTSVEYEQAQVGTQILRGSLGPIGIVKIDLTTGDQMVRVFLNDNAGKAP